MVVWTAHFKPQQQFDLPIVLFRQFIKLLFTLDKRVVDKCVDGSTLNMLGKAQHINALLYCGKDIFLHRVVRGIVVAKVGVNVQIALFVCFHTKSLARFRVFVNASQKLFSRLVCLPNQAT